MNARRERFVPTGDIIGDICRAFERETGGAVPPEVARRVEEQARAAYALDRVYIASVRYHEVKERLQRVDPNRPAPEQARELGLGRVTVWRHIKRLQLKPK